MSQSTRAQLEALKEEVIISGRRSTSAVGVRSMVTALIDSLVNILDDKDQPDGYLGLDENAIVPLLKYINEYSTSAEPGMSRGSVLGSGSSSSIDGTNSGGVITLTAGTGCANASAVIEISFDNLIYPNGCGVTISPGNSNAALIAMPIIYVESGMGSFLIKTSTAVKLTDSLTYIINYTVKGF